ncbi:hypothetical protein JAO78_008775 [Alishewanella sp. 16-MA]|uniref:Abortive infection protein-like C-terminal domain-containing protein n=1 Tax=Alishewanella maricola TaxID=2795740 RepID=A0ABS8C3K4_9ALTE|nr:hypothetical protein [Alishewanella maricola]MCB5226908.1 hypothetical protein [Alishewanella maricola]
MSVNWITAYNRLFKIINAGGDCYYGGSAFIQMAQQVDDSIPNYNQFIQLRNQQGKSTSRKDFYWDIINGLEEPQKYQLFRLFIEALEPFVKDEIEGIRSVVFGGGSAVPTTIIPQNLWSSEKLNISLKDIDNAIDAQQFNRAVTLAYTCLEGLYKAYVRENIPDQANVTSLIPLSKLVKNDISAKLRAKGNFPEEIVNTLPTLTNGIANSRNSFSESHFDKDANKWLAIYARDLTNSIGRLLLHFV